MPLTSAGGSRVASARGRRARRPVHRLRAHRPAAGRVGAAPGTRPPAQPRHRAVTPIRRGQARRAPTPPRRTDAGAPARWLPVVDGDLGRAGLGPTTARSDIAVGMALGPALVDSRGDSGVARPQHEHVGRRRPDGPSMDVACGGDGGCGGGTVRRTATPGRWWCVSGGAGLPTAAAGGPKVTVASILRRVAGPPRGARAGEPALVSMSGPATAASGGGIGVAEHRGSQGGAHAGRRAKQQRSQPDPLRRRADRASSRPSPGRRHQHRSPRRSPRPSNVPSRPNSASARQPP